MIIKRIIFIVVSPFNKRDYKRFGIELLERNGFMIEVWDLFHIFHPELAKTRVATDLVGRSNYKIFYEKNNVLKRLKGLNSDTFIVPFCIYNLKSYFIYKAVSSRGIGYAYLAWAYPFFTESGNKLKKGLLDFRADKKKAWRKMADYAFRKCPSRLLGIKPVRLLLSGGREGLKYVAAPLDNSTEILWIHTMDYDLYLEEKNKGFTERPIAVFLDAYHPFHSDYVLSGRNAPISADRYYSLLNKFFKRVENELGLEVVIAAHPRSNYESHPDYFEGRKCLKGQTIQLVKESKLVLAHNSTAINFANFFYKPVIFLTSSDFDRNLDGYWIRRMAESFGKKPIFMDKDSDIDWKEELTIDKSLYDSYRHAYIKTTGSPELPLWQIVSDRLKKGF